MSKTLGKVDFMIQKDFGKIKRMQCHIPKSVLMVFFLKASSRTRLHEPTVIVSMPKVTAMALFLVQLLARVRHAGHKRDIHSQPIKNDYQPHKVYAAIAMH